MAKLWVVAKREYLERVRTKWFFIATFFGPVLFGALMIVLFVYLYFVPFPVFTRAVDDGKFEAAIADWRELLGNGLVLIAPSAHGVPDGHETVAGDLLYRGPDEKSWQRTALLPMVNDRFTASFPVTELGRYEGRVVSTDLPAAARAELEAALSNHLRTSP